MLRTDGDQVAVVDIHHIGGHITEHGLRIGVHLIVAHRHVTTGEDGVADDDTCDVELVPDVSVGRLILQPVKVVGRYELTSFIGAATVGDGYVG